MDITYDRADLDDLRKERLKIYGTDVGNNDQSSNKCCTGDLENEIKTASCCG